MNVLILEDELITAEELQHYLREIVPDVQIQAVIETVEEAVEYLNTQSLPDLIFSDIQLADGLSFEVFEQVKIRCPVIFCTAFDEYAIQAFSANGIAYVLKPFDRKAIVASLARFENLQSHFRTDEPTQPDVNISLQQLLSQLKPAYRTTFLINQKGKYFPVLVNDIAFFYTEYEFVWLMKGTGEKYPIEFTLDELENILNPVQFYRANRQYIIRFEAVKELEPYFNRKLLVRLVPHSPEPIIISKAKASNFMRWLEER